MDPKSRDHFRGKPRPERRVPIRYAVAGGTDVESSTKNIGVGGTFILTAHPPEVGSILRVTLPLANGSPPLIIDGAEVRWSLTGTSKEPGMGVRFPTLDAEKLMTLTEFLDSFVDLQEM